MTMKLILTNSSNSTPTMQDLHKHGKSIFTVTLGDSITAYTTSEEAAEAVWEARDSGRSAILTVLKPAGRTGWKVACEETYEAEESDD